VSSDLAPTSTPHTVMEWIIFGASVGGAAVAGAVGQAFGLSKRIAALELQLKDVPGAKAELVAVKDSTAQQVAAGLASVRGELAAVADRAARAEATAQAAATGAGDPRALRLAIADELAANPRIKVVEEEVKLLRQAEIRGAQNHIETVGLLREVNGRLAGL
jgi:hypothetical protein